MKYIVFWIGIASAFQALASIEKVQQLDDVVYLLYENSSALKRYSLSQENSLESIELGTTASSFLVDDDTIYFSNNTSLYQYDNGAISLVHTTDREILGVEILDGKLIVSTDFYLQSLNKETKAVLGEGPQLRIDGDIVVSRERNTIYGDTTGTYPNGLNAIDLNQDGSFTNYRNAQRRHYAPLAFYLTPSPEHIIDSKGLVYDTNQLNVQTGFGLRNTENISDLNFIQGTPVLLVDGALRAYDDNYEFVETYELSTGSASRFVKFNGYFFVFSDDENLPAEKVDIDWLLRTDPTKPINPDGLVYHPDYIELDRDGDILYLFDREYANLFRYSVVQGAYLPSIALQESPLQISYSPNHNRMYVRYSNAIGFVDLDSLEESPLVSDINDREISYIYADVGDYWIAKGDSDIFILDENGTVVFQDDWGFYGPEQWLFVPSKNRLYQVESQSFYWFDFDFPDNIEEGYQRLSFKHYLSDSALSYASISPLLNNAVLSNGMVVQTTNMRDGIGYLDAIRSSYPDLDWLNGNVFALTRTYNSDISTFSSNLIRFNADLMRSEDDTLTFSGEPLQLIPLRDASSLIAVVSESGIPTFHTVVADHRDFDNDGVLDGADFFPADPDETEDFDSDGIGNNTDPDDDNDSYNDDVDAFPFNSEEWFDTDNDGIGNNADTDDDNDGVLDVDDAFPTDATEQYDTDGDGIGNNADNDDDNDTFLDTDDAFPLDRWEWLDTDGDGVGNNTDTDDDNDGVRDLADAYPVDEDRYILNATDYFPMLAGNTWLYTGHLGRETVLGDRISIQGKSLLPVEFGSGAKFYLYPDNDQLLFMGFYLPSITIAGQAYSLDITLEEGASLLDSNSSTGFGDANIQPTYGDVDISWSSSSNYGGNHTIFTPAGTFEAIRTRFVINVTAVIQEQAVSVVYEVGLSFVEDIGIAGIYESAGATSLLEQFSVVPVTNQQASPPNTGNSSNGGNGASNDSSGGGAFNLYLLLCLVLMASYRALHRRRVCRSYSKE